MLKDQLRPLASAADGPASSQQPRRQQPGRESVAVADFEIRLPATLGHVTRARAVGPEGAPLIAVLGGISANRFVCGRQDGTPGWWAGLVGEGAAIDPRAHRVLGLDFAADETGQTAPSSVEQAAVLCAALDHLEVAKAHAIVGASYGGMVGLALGQHFPDRAERLVVISAAAEQHPASTAWRELQRRVVALGIANGNKEEALAIARGMGMLSYRTAEEFEQRFEGGLECADPLGCTEPGEYLRARGAAFRRVMSAERFLSLSAAIDRHHVDPEKIRTPALLIGADTDQLVFPAQMKALAARLAGPAELHMLHSLYGHDMFFKESERIGALIKPFLDSPAQ